MSKIWEGILMCIVVTAVAGLALFISQPKHTVRYELNSDCNNTGIPAIRVDIENGCDDVIHLSKEITWNKAIQMVDSLNNSLKSIK